MSAEPDILAALTLKRSQLEQDVVDKRQALAEAEAKLSAFRADALSALGAASGSKSAQKQRAERQAVVASLLKLGLSRAEIVRRTAINDHLVGYDIDCIRRKRPKQGTKKGMATGTASRNSDLPIESRVTDPIEPKDKLPLPLPPPPPPPPPPPLSPRETLSEKPKASPYVRSPSDPPAKFGEIRQGCSASRSQLKAAIKSHRQGERDTATFITTVDNNHAHTASLDRQGDGETDLSEGHFHRIANYELIEGSHDHNHGLTLEEGIEE